MWSQQSALVAKNTTPIEWNFYFIFQDPISKSLSLDDIYRIFYPHYNMPDSYWYLISFIHQIGHVHQCTIKRRNMMRSFRFDMDIYSMSSPVGQKKWDKQILQTSLSKIWFDANIFYSNWSRNWEFPSSRPFLKSVLTWNSALSY